MGIKCCKVVVSVVTIEAPDELQLAPLLLKLGVSTERGQKPDSWGNLLGRGPREMASKVPSGSQSSDFTSP